MLICNTLLVQYTECFPLTHQKCLPASTTCCDTEEDILCMWYKSKVRVRTPFPKWSDNEHQRWRNSKNRSGKGDSHLHSFFLSAIYDKK